MPGKSKRPRLQTTAASDIASPATHQFTHSSNSSTRTRQIVTSARLESSEPITSPSPLIEMNSPSFDDIPVTEASELDLPAGIELRTKARRYVNSVCSS
jgi:hypothetical protein